MLAAWTEVPCSCCMQAESGRDDVAARTLVSGLLTGWDAESPFPRAEIRTSLGQAGEIESETKVVPCRPHLACI